MRLIMIKLVTTKKVYVMKMKTLFGAITQSLMITKDLILKLQEPNTMIRPILGYITLHWLVQPQISGMNLKKVLG